MKIPTVVFTLILSITLNGSCELNAAAADAKPAEGEEQAAKQPQADPRFAGLPVQHHEYYKKLVKQKPRMMEAWFKSCDLYAAAHRCATVFGLRERKRARGKLPALLSKAERARLKFEKAYYKFRKPIEKEESKLKDRAMDISEKGAAVNDPRMNKRLDELYDTAYVLGEQLNALAKLKGVFHASAKIPTDLEMLGLSAHDSLAAKVAAENPKLLEARLLIKDCETDIAALAKLKADTEADPKKRWGSADKTKVKKAELMLEKAITLLERETKKAKAPFLREAAKMTKKVESTQEKIVALEKSRRSAVSYYDRLSSYDVERREHLDAAAVIDRLAVWKKPEKKDGGK